MHLGLDFPASETLLAWLASVLPVGEEQGTQFQSQLNVFLIRE